MAMLFTSDLHFYHKNIVKFTDRGKFTTPEDHNEWLIDLWNSQVKPDDVVYHLGDFSFNHAKALDILHKLNGLKHMILGNHDLEHSRYHGHLDNDTVRFVGNYRNIKLGEVSAVLFHYPIASWHGQARGAWHLHGHSHGNYAGQGKLLDVGLDSAFTLLGEHRLFTVEDIAKYMVERPVYAADRHREVKDDSR